MNNLYIISFNCISVIITLFLGYILPINPCRYKHKYANRYYPGKFKPFNIIVSLIVIAIYFIIYYYIRLFMNEMIEGDHKSIYSVDLIITLYIFPFLFMIWFTRSKYDNIEILYNEATPDKIRLRELITNYSNEKSSLYNKAVINDLCRIYLKKFAKDEEILNLKISTDDSRISTKLFSKFILLLAITIIIMYFFKINFAFAFLVSISTTPFFNKWNKQGR